MAKYSKVIRDVEAMFVEPLFTGTDRNNAIPVYPDNFQGGNFSEEFCRVEVIPAQSLTTYGALGVAGVIIVQIYTRAGQGARRVMEIADAIDARLQSRTLDVSTDTVGDGTLTGTSSLSFVGIDPQDNSLFRADYSVPFRNYYQLLR